MYFNFNATRKNDFFDFLLEAAFLERLVKAPQSDNAPLRGRGREATLALSIINGQPPKLKSKISD
jgi:hypothetical protein